VTAKLAEIKKEKTKMEKEILADNEVGYVNELGEVLIDFSKEISEGWIVDLRSFEFVAGEWSAEVFTIDGAGRINLKGEFIVEPKFRAVEPFDINGLAGIWINGKVGFINRAGEIVIKNQFDDISNRYMETRIKNILGVKLNDKWGYINTSGDFVIEPKFEFGYSFDGNGFACVKIDEKWGWINTSGAFIIEAKFEAAYPFNDNGLACVKINGKWGFINSNAEFLIKPKFENAYNFDGNGFAQVQINNKWGCIDKNGDFVIEAKFENLFSFDDGIAQAKMNSLWGCINTSGIFVIEPKFEEIGSFSEFGIAMIEEVDGKNGFINRKGEYVIQPIIEVYSNISFMGISWLANVKVNGKWGCVDRKKGKFIIEPKFEKLGSYHLSDKIAGIIAATLNGKCGFINLKGEFVS
jgi:hypothetical protein